MVQRYCFPSSKSYLSECTCSREEKILNICVPLIPKRRLFLEGKVQAMKQYHMPRIQRSAFQEIGFQSFQMFLAHYEWPFLAKNRQERKTVSIVQLWNGSIDKKGLTHWSKKNNDCVSKSPVFIFYKLVFSDGGKWYSILWIGRRSWFWWVATVYMT